MAKAITSFLYREEKEFNNKNGEEEKRVGHSKKKNFFFRKICNLIN
jgi:hypothetical protein